MSTALKREHHFVKKGPSSEADLRSRLWKWARRCNGASTRAPKFIKKSENWYENIGSDEKMMRAFRTRVSEKKRGNIL